MNLVVFHEACMHAQYVLLNCDSYEAANPYLERARAVGTCKSCGLKLVQLTIVVMKGKEAEGIALHDPDAIDLRSCKPERRRTFSERLFGRFGARKPPSLGV